MSEEVITPFISDKECIVLQDQLQAIHVANHTVVKPAEFTFIVLQTLAAYTDNILVGARGERIDAGV